MEEKKTILKLEEAVIAQAENVLLSKVNLKLEEGDFVYLIGETGSGKSSLLKTLYAELPLRDGHGLVCDFLLHKLKRKQVPFLRRKLGIVFQDFELLTDRSVHDNLLFVLRATGWKGKQEISKRIEKVLSDVGLGSKGYKMPHELSGGEQQRVAIARALLNDPLLILADEPTGNLDPQTTEGILILLQKIASTGTCVLMATHDYEAMTKFSSRVLKCEGGYLVEQNSHAAI